MDIMVMGLGTSILCLTACASWGAVTNLTCVLDAIVAKGRVAYETNSVGTSAVVKKVTTVDFFLFDETERDVHRVFKSINEAFERDFTHQMRQRYPTDYAAAMRSAGNPHNPAVDACWRHMEDCVKATQVWQAILFYLKNYCGAKQISFRPPEKFYLDGRDVRQRCFHISAWGFAFSDEP